MIKLKGGMIMKVFISLGKLSESGTRRYVMLLLLSKILWLDFPLSGLVMKYAWYVDPTPATDEAFANYDLLSVAKHEIGHILGILGDYEDPARRDEVMWYAFAQGERRHPSEKDFNELRKLRYHVTPEPATMLPLGIGLLAIAAVRRKMSA